MDDFKKTASMIRAYLDFAKIAAWGSPSDKKRFFGIFERMMSTNPAFKQTAQAGGAPFVENLAQRFSSTGVFPGHQGSSWVNDALKKMHIVQNAERAAQTGIPVSRLTAMSRAVPGL